VNGNEATSSAENGFDEDSFDVDIFSKALLRLAAWRRETQE